MKAAEDILNGPGYFYCERHKLRMKKEHCVYWQTPGAKPFDLDKSIVECANCKQGKTIRRSSGVVMDGQGLSGNRKLK